MEGVRSELAGEVADARALWVAENQYNAMLQVQMSIGERVARVFDDWQLVNWSMGWCSFRLTLLLSLHNWHRR